jgi:glycosyltransferase involved in cell wall biosynthesis
MSISIIVSTYNGAGKIVNLLRSLTQQSYRDFELVIVVDGSLDNTEEVVKQYEGHFSEFKLIVQANKGRSAVRNRGVKEASGEVLIFYDDDMVPEEESIQKHINFHLNNKGILSGNSVELEDKTKTDIQNYKAFLTKKWTEKYGDGYTQLDKENLFYTAANCSMKRNTFESLNGFDERLTDAEDYDLGYRALRMNIPVYFDKGNKAIHQEAITCASYIRRLRTYNKAHIKLKEFYPERLTISKTTDPNKGKRLIYWILASSFWVKLIDMGLMRWIMPQHLRYKFYDGVIESLAIRFPLTRL